MESAGDQYVSARLRLASWGKSNYLWIEVRLEVHLEVSLGEL